MTTLQDMARQCGLKPASELAPLIEPRTSRLPFSTQVPAPDFVVIDVETACNRAPSMCQIGFAVKHSHLQRYPRLCQLAQEGRIRRTEMPRSPASANARFEAGSSLTSGRSALG